MFGIGATELIIILVLALVIFGPGKLPEVGKAVGRSIREFKRATSIEESDSAEAGPAHNTEAATPGASSTQNSE